MDQNGGNYEVSKLCIPPQNWMSKVVVLLNFTTMNIYQEAYSLSHQYNALVGKYAVNC